MMESHSEEKDFSLLTPTWDSDSVLSTEDVPLHTHDDTVPKKLSTLQLICLTICTGGLQMVWSVVLSGGTPYLRSLGLGKSATALVWVSSPLAGTFVQPCFGALSDNCRSRWGRRKPFMVGGAIATITSIISLAWASKFVHFAGRILGRGDADAIESWTKASAIFWILALNLSIQPLQCGIRAFIVDNCTASQQVVASAWASRVVGMSNVVGFLLGYMDLTASMWFLGNTHFRVLSAIAVIVLTTTVSISCWSIREQDSRVDFEQQSSANPKYILRNIFRAMRTLPAPVRKVCLTQFFAWMAWFPFLFYTTTYIGDIYSRPVHHAYPNLEEGTHRKLHLYTGRKGTFALFIFALVSLASSFVLPLLAKTQSHQAPYEPQAFRLTLPRLWACAHLLYAACMLATLFVKSAGGSVVLIGLVGASWAATLWIPFAVISRNLALAQARSQLGDEIDRPASGRMQSGTVLAIHNMAISSPQILAALAFSAMFALLRHGGVEDVIGWALRTGGVAALVAAWFASTIKDDTGI